MERFNIECQEIFAPLQVRLQVSLNKQTINQLVGAATDVTVILMLPGLYIHRTNRRDRVLHTAAFRMCGAETHKEE